MRTINISTNKLEHIDLAAIPNGYSREFYFEKNNLIEIEHFTRSHFPMLTNVSIWYNKFSCKFLTSFLLPLQHWTKPITFVSNPWITKPDTDCNPKMKKQTDFDNNTEILDKVKTVDSAKDSSDLVTENFDATISYKGTEMNATALLYIIISLPIIVVIIIASICFILQRRLCKRRITNDYDEPINLTNEDGVGIEIQSIHSENASLDEPIYEEIPDIDETYDHLCFNTSPMPISIKKHYDNHLLLKKRQEDAQNVSLNINF